MKWVPHSWPPQDAPHRCGNKAQRRRNPQRKTGTETRPLTRHPRQFPRDPLPGTDLHHHHHRQKEKKETYTFSGNKQKAKGVMGKWRRKQTNPIDSGSGAKHLRGERSTHRSPFSRCLTDPRRERERARGPASTVIWQF